MVPWSGDMKQGGNEKEFNARQRSRPRRTSFMRSALSLVERCLMVEHSNASNPPSLVELISVYKNPVMWGSLLLLSGTILLLLVGLGFLTLVTRTERALIVNLVLVLVCVASVAMAYTICIQIRQGLLRQRSRH